MTVNVNDSTLQ